MHFLQLGDNMTRKKRPNFSPEFNLESAQLVVDQNYSVRQAAEAVNVSASSMDKWSRQLREERNGTSFMPNAQCLNAGSTQDPRTGKAYQAD